MRKITAAAGAAGMIVVAGWGASALANADTGHTSKPLDTHRTVISSCPGGYGYRNVNVGDVSVWACAKGGGPVATATVATGPTVTATVTSGPTVTATVTTSAPAPTVTVTTTTMAPGPTVTVTVTCNPNNTPQCT